MTRLLCILSLGIGSLQALEKDQSYHISPQISPIRETVPHVLQDQIQEKNNFLNQNTLLKVSPQEGRDFLLNLEKASALIELHLNVLEKSIKKILKYPKRNKRQNPKQMLNEALTFIIEKMERFHHLHEQFFCKDANSYYFTVLTQHPGERILIALKSFPYFVKKLENFSLSSFMAKEEEKDMLTIFKQELDQYQQDIQENLKNINNEIQFVEFEESKVDTCEVKEDIFLFIMD